jgi:hypothetical protein
LAVTDAAVEPRSPDVAAGALAYASPPDRETSRRGHRFAGVGVTAGGAVVAGVLLLTRDQPVATLGTLTIGIGALALLVAAAAIRELPWARHWTGPDGTLERVAGPMAWLAVIFAAVVVLTNFVPIVVPAWSEEQVFAVAIVTFVVLSVLGWGPGVSVAWPRGLRLSTLTVLGSLVALALVAVYLVFMLLLRADAISADDRAWARLVEIRATLEALAFAAAGALLGTVVQRQAVSGELRSLEELVGQRERELAEARAAVASRELEVESMRASGIAALRLLTPGAPGDLDTLEPDSPALLVARPSTTAVRQARRTLLDALKMVASGEH